MPNDLDENETGSVQVQEHLDMLHSYGAERPNSEWILTGFDVWERNPHFTGKRTAEHPEQD